MLIESIPTDVFVPKALKDRRIARIIEGWRVDLEDVANVVIGYLKDLSFFVIYDEQKEDIIKCIIYYLNRSKKIVQMVEKADHAERQRKQTNHEE